MVRAVAGETRGVSQCQGALKGSQLITHTLNSCVMHPFKRKELGEILLCGVSLCSHRVSSSGGGSSLCLVF